MITRGVLLDIDGTLLDGNDAHATAWRRALHDEGLTVGHDEVRLRRVCELAVRAGPRGDMNAMVTIDETFHQG